MAAMGSAVVNPITEIISSGSSIIISSASVRNLGEAIAKAVNDSKISRTKKEHSLFVRTNNVNLTKIDPESDSSQLCEPRSEQNSAG